MNLKIPEFQGYLRKFMLRVPDPIHQCSGIKIFGKHIKSVLFSTDVSIIRNTNANSIIAVYPFTPQPVITQAIMEAADVPVFAGVGGGLTQGKRVENLAAIHGDLSQGERDRVMGQFRSGKLRYLVATDVVGRGIDVSGISHIINYDVPAFCDDYVHRVGRTGRMGREGVAFTFVTVQEGAELTRIEMRIDKLLKRAELKGFESFTKPSDPNANLDDLTSDAPVEAKPVYGKPVRKVRRAL